MSEIDTAVHTVEHVWASFIRLCLRCKNFRIILESILREDGESDNVANNHNIWVLNNALQSFSSILHEVIELSERLFKNNTEIQETTSVVGNAIMVKSTFGNFPHFEIDSLTQRLQQCAVDLQVSSWNEENWQMEDIEDMKRYFAASVLRIFKDFSNNQTGSTSLVERETLLEEIKIDIQDQWKLISTTWRKRVGNEVLTHLATTKTEDMFKESITDCELVITTILGWIDYCLFHPEQDLLLLAEQILIKNFVVPFTRDNEIEEQSDSPDNTIFPVFTTSPLLPPASSSLVGSLHSTEDNSSAGNLQVIKLLRNVVEKYNSQRHAAISDWQFYTSVMRGLNDINLEFGVCMINLLTSLLSLWMESPTEHVNFMTLFFSLYRLDGSPKISDPIIAAKLGEIMGDYFLFQAERKYSKRIVPMQAVLSSTMSVTETIALYHHDDYVQAMHFYTYAMTTIESVLAEVATQKIEDTSSYIDESGKHVLDGLSFTKYYDTMNKRASVSTARSTSFSFQTVSSTYLQNSFVDSILVRAPSKQISSSPLPKEPLEWNNHGADLLHENPIVSCFHRLCKKKQQVFALYLLSCLDTMMGPFLNQIVSDYKQLKSLLATLQSIGGLLIVDFSKQGQLCYRKLMSIIDHNKAAMSIEEKHQIATIVINELGATTTRYVEPNLYSKHKHRLNSFREKLSQLAKAHENSSFASLPHRYLFDSWSNHLYELVKHLLMDCIDKLGSPPDGSEWCVVLCGSLARREACPYSDVELFFLYRSTKLPSQNPLPYLIVLSHLLELSFISLGETKTALRSYGDRPLQLLNGGVQLDSNFNPSNNCVEMIVSVDQLLERIKTMDQVQLNLVCATDCVYGSTQLYDEYKERLLVQMRSQQESPQSGLYSQHQLSSVVLQDCLKEFLDRSNRQNWMKDHLKFLSIILNQLCIHHCILECGNIKRIEQLCIQKKLTPVLKDVLIDMVMWMTSLRCKLHLYYQKEREDFIVNPDHTLHLKNKNHEIIEEASNNKKPSCYVLSEYDSVTFLHYESHIKSLLIQLVKAFCHSTTSDLETTAGRVGSIFQELAYSGLVNIADYWVLRSEEELRLHRRVVSISKQETASSATKKVQHIFSRQMDLSCDPYLLRSNLFFEYAVHVSPLGAMASIKRNIVKRYITTDGISNVSSFANENKSHVNHHQQQQQEKPVIDTEGNRHSLTQEMYGRCMVYQLGDSLHLKAFPELPGIEYLASNFSHQISRHYLTSFSMLHKFRDPTKKMTVPVLISKSVIGQNLQEVLSRNPNFLEQELDSECYSWHVIRTLLTSPEDDKPDNFVVYYTGGGAGVDNSSLSCTNISRTAKLVCVDNDHSFATPIVTRVFHDELVVKSIIYCSKRMLEPLHPNVIEAIKQWKPDALIREWLENAVKQDSVHCSMFPSDSFIQTSFQDKERFKNRPVLSALLNNTRTVIPLLVDPNLGLNLFLKMKGLQILIASQEASRMSRSAQSHDSNHSSQPNDATIESSSNNCSISSSVVNGVDLSLTHLHLLHHLEPELEKKYYGRVLNDETLLTTEDRFNALTKNLYKMVESCRRSQINTFTMLQSSVGKLPSEKDIRERAVGSLKEMKKTFELTMPPNWIQYAKSIQKELLVGNDARYNALPNDVLREEVISGIWTPQGHSLMIGIDYRQLEAKSIDYSKVLTTLEQRTNTFQRLSFKNCNMLTNERLIRIIKKSPKLLVLDIRGCGQLTSAVLLEIPQYCYSLQQCLHELDDYAKEFGMLLTVYRMVTRDTTLKYAELASIMGEGTRFSLERYHHIIMKLIALELLSNTSYTHLECSKPAISEDTTMAADPQTTLKERADDSMEKDRKIFRDFLISASKMTFSYIQRIKKGDDELMMMEVALLMFLSVMKYHFLLEEEQWSWIQGYTVLMISIFNKSNIARTTKFVSSWNDGKKLDAHGIPRSHSNVRRRELLSLSLLLLICKIHHVDDTLQLQIQDLFLMLCAKGMFRTFNFNHDSDLSPDVSPVVGQILTVIKSCCLGTNDQVCNKQDPSWSSEVDSSMMTPPAVPSITFDRHFITLMKENSDALLSGLITVYDKHLMVHIEDEMSELFLPLCKDLETKLRDCQNASLSLAKSSHLNNNNGNNIWARLRKDPFDQLNQFFIATDQTLPKAVHLWLTNRELALKKYGHISSWNTSNVTNMQGLFQGATTFSDPIGTWDVSNVTNMNFMFFNCSSFDKPLYSWNVSKVTSMRLMLCGTIALHHRKIEFHWNLSPSVDKAFLHGFFCDNKTLRKAVSLWCEDRTAAINTYGVIQTWNTSLVTDMSGLFKDIRTFDDDISEWDVSSVISMRDMFLNCSTFDQSLDAWDVTSVEDMSGMFYRASSFNQPLNKWKVDKVVNMSHMFYKASQFNQSLDEWNVSNVNNMSYMFYHASSFNQPLNDWNVSKVKNMSYMFYNANLFNQSLHSWDVSRVTSMYLMFCGAAELQSKDICEQWSLEQVVDKEYLYAFAFVDHTMLQEAIETWSQHRKVAEMKYGPIQTWNTCAVTDMTGLFKGMTTFDEDISKWDVSNVTSMCDLFNGAVSFDHDISQWNVANVMDMKRMFYGATAFNRSLSQWNVGNVTDMSEMFCCATSFDQVIDDWDVSNVMTMKGMFQDAKHFNQSLSKWNVNRVEDMSCMFCKALSFNQPIGTWTVKNVKTMKSMFHSSTNFNQPLLSWNTSQVEDMSYMFYQASSFNQPLHAWQVHQVNDMSYMFQQALVFNQPLSTWEVSAVVDMSGMFGGASAFNGALNEWNVSNVLSMRSMFYNTLLFNQPLNQWNVNKVTTMSGMFWRSFDFNQPLDNWNVSQVTDMSYMFNNAIHFNQSINAWNVENVTDMSYMFNAAFVFNRALDQWNVSNVTNMNAMFQAATTFNQPLESWNVQNVQSMRSMFAYAVAFNQRLDDWDVRNVNDMSFMFQDARTFNQSINNWKVRNVRYMNGLFQGAISFNQPLSKWLVFNVIEMNGIFEGAVAFQYREVLNSSWLKFMLNDVVAVGDINDVSFES